jgi:hypothetical protein
MIYSDYAFKVPEEKMVRVITNTDAKNEADDQFAIVQTMLSPRFDNIGYIAAHFGAPKRTKESMMDSYRELEIVFDKMGFPKEGNIFKGAPTAMQDKVTPVDSEGAQLIIREAMKDDPRKLFVTFFGPLTDLASAYLLEPRIAGRLTAVWIGGGPYPNGGREFNLGNDIHAANVVFESAIEVWQVPRNVYELIPVTFAELEARIYDKGAIGKYLYEQLAEHCLEEVPRRSPFRTGEGWVLGDNPAVGLILYEQRCNFDWVQAPLITPDMTYVQTKLNRPIRVYNYIDSRLILEDMYAKIELLHKRHPNGYKK